MRISATEGEMCKLTMTDSRACHFLFCPVHRRIRSLKKYRRITNTVAEPMTEAVAEMKKPFMP